MFQGLILNSPYGIQTIYFPYYPMYLGNVRQLILMNTEPVKQMLTNKRDQNKGCWKQRLQKIGCNRRLSMQDDLYQSIINNET